MLTYSLNHITETFLLMCSLAALPSEDKQHCTRLPRIAGALSAACWWQRVLPSPSGTCKATHPEHWHSTQMTRNSPHTWRVSASCLAWIPPWQKGKARRLCLATPPTHIPWEAHATMHSQSDSAWRDSYSALPCVLLVLAQGLCLVYLPLDISCELCVNCKPWNTPNRCIHSTVHSPHRRWSEYSMWHYGVERRPTVSTCIYILFFHCAAHLYMRLQFYSHRTPSFNFLFRKKYFSETH